MLILVPLKTQENAVAKWKGGKKELTKWEAVVFSRLEKGTLRKLESKTESGKRNVKEWLFLCLILFLRQGEGMHHQFPRGDRELKCLGFTALLCK